MNLAFCIKRNDLGLFVCCLRSIVLHGGCEHYDVYVLETCLENSMKAALSRDFKDVITFHFISDGENLCSDISDSWHHPKEVFYRAALPLLLPKNVDRALYLDVNTVVINSIKGLYETDFDGNDNVARTHSFNASSNFDHASARYGTKLPAIDSNVLFPHCVNS